MQIKRFEARDTTEALSLIKREFGPDAVILSVRTVKRQKGMFSYLKKPGIEVTAATDSLSSQDKKKKSKHRTGISYEFESIRPGYNAESENRGASIKTNLEPYALKFNESLPVLKSYDKFTDREEIGQLKQLMLQQGVETDLAVKWLKELKETLDNTKPLNSEILKQGLIQALTTISKTVGPPKTDRRKRNTIVFVGPTGVGKTTTIAKLAAIHALKMKKKVALITLDNYRIAAIDQLKAYAKIIGIPVESASNKKELIRSLKMLRNRDFILIDTPGMSQKNKKQINELKNIIEGVPNIQIQLLMSVPTNNLTLEDILGNFKTMPITGLIFTKLDESTTFGNIVNSLCSANTPISYFTNGQEIPEDIEIASLDKVVNLIIGESKWNSLVSIPPRLLELEEESPNKPLMDFYVANRSSDVFHEPDCKSARKIKATSMIVFEGAANAINKGYKPCRLCNPYKCEEHNMVISGTR